MPVPISKRRFWDKVDKHGPVHPVLGTRCYEWAASTVGGYGQVWVAGRVVKAHRHAWTLYRGPIPGGLLVLHKCDNPPCVRPDHLFLGTKRDNARDCVAKGRHNRARGERAGSAMLTEELVRYIRRVYRYGCRCFGFYGLARELGVTPQSVRDIVTGKSWKHVV